MAKARPRRRPAKEMEQPAIPELADAKNEKVHQAALHLIDQRNKSKDTKKDEKAALESLLDTMRKENVEFYHYGKLHVTLQAKTLVKAKMDKEKKPKPKKPRKKKADAE